MTLYNVHIYREMRLYFPGIEAGSLEAAASIAADKLTPDAQVIDDCDGETLSALVDVVGDEEEFFRAYFNKPYARHVLSATSSGAVRSRTSRACSSYSMTCRTIFPK